MSTTSLTKVETITTDDIKSWSAEEIADYVKGAQSAVKTASKYSHNATDRAAYATWLAEFSLGVIGKYEVESNKPSGWMSDKDWADKFDKARSNVGYWRLLGRVMLDLGVTKDEPEYTRLRISNLYQNTKVKEMINAKDTTPENIRERLNKALADHNIGADGKKVKPEGGTPNKNTADEKKAEKAKTLGEVVEAMTGSDKAKALVVVATLAKIVEKFDGDSAIDDWTEVDTAYEALRTKMNGKFEADLNVAKTA